jgi:hypothetical protein
LPEGEHDERGTKSRTDHIRQIAPALFQHRSFRFTKGTVTFLFSSKSDHSFIMPKKWSSRKDVILVLCIILLQYEHMTKQVYSSVLHFVAAFLGSLLLCTLFGTKVQAQEYEEVSYDDLVRQISSKKSKVVEQKTSILDDITLHAGVGLVTSSMNVSESNRNLQMQMQGFQISLGVDLFSPNFVAEGAIRNFGTGASGDESRTFRELDLKVFYRSLPSSNIGNVGYRFGAGLGTQYLTVSDPSNQINEATPASILFAGIETNLSKNFGVGAELGYRSSLLSSSADRDSVDLMLRLDTYF